MIEVISHNQLKSPIQGISDPFIAGTKLKQGAYLVIGLEEYLKRGSFPEHAHVLKTDTLLDFSRRKQKERAG